MISPQESDTIAVWVSCGAASAAAAIIAKQRYGNFCNLRFVNNPIAEEHEDNVRFLKDLEKYLGVDIETAINHDWPSCSIFDVFEKRRFMSSPYGAPCTGELKKKARQNWEAKNKPDWHIMGFTYDEKDRHDKFILSERGNVIPVLIDAMMTKDDCGKMMEALGIKMSMAYDLGMPNANCIGCVKATSATYWNLIRRIAPERFARICIVSRDIGARLVRWNGKRMFLDELPENAKGNPIKSMNIECGLFCEEKWK